MTGPKSPENPSGLLSKNLELVMNIRYLLPILALLLLSSCCAVCNDGPKASLAGATWTLQELSGQPIELPAGAKAPSITFSEGKVQGSDGCNQYQGSYEEREGRLTFGPLAATRRFCGEPTSAIEQGFYQALDSHTGYRVKDATLELLRANEVLAKFQRP
jgi:heat shock protein HslJ